MLLSSCFFFALSFLPFWQDAPELNQAESMNVQEQASEEPVYDMSKELQAPVFNKRPNAKYPEQAYGSKISGEVRLEAVANKDGSIGQINILQGIDEGELGFEAAAIEALNSWEFKPGLKDGEPVNIRFQAVMKFVPPSEAYMSNMKVPVFTFKVAPRYPKLRIAIPGNKYYVILSAILQKDGKVEDVKVLNPSPNGRLGFEKEAIFAVKQWKFIPGTLAGKPADVRMTLRIDFKLN